MNENEVWPINKERARKGLPPITQCVAAPAPPLAEIARLLTVMFGSATARVDESGDVLGYVTKTGALHRLVGLMQECGYPVVIPARMPEERAALASVEQPQSDPAQPSDEEVTARDAASGVPACADCRTADLCAEGGCAVKDSPPEGNDVPVAWRDTHDHATLYYEHPGTEYEVEPLFLASGLGVGCMGCV